MPEKPTKYITMTENEAILQALVEFSGRPVDDFINVELEEKGLIAWTKENLVYFFGTCDIQNRIAQIFFEANYPAEEED